MKKIYRLVVYKCGDDSYKKVIGKPTDNIHKLEKAEQALDKQLSDDFYSVIEEVKWYAMKENVESNLDLLWVVLLILLTANGPDGLDLLDVIITYVDSLK